MAKKIIFKVVNGVEVPLPQYLPFYNEIMKENEGKLTSHMISKVYKARTLKQNSTFWGPFENHMMKFFRYLGCPLLSFEVQDFIRKHFFPKRSYSINDRIYSRTPSSTELSTVEMNDIFAKANEVLIDKGFQPFEPERVLEEIEEL